MSPMSFRVYWNIFKNMGVRYTLFRAGYELKMRSGLLKRKFPSNVSFKTFITLDEWKRKNIPFFFSQEHFALKKYPDIKLEAEAKNVFKGKILFFSSLEKKLGQDYNWRINPETNFEYDKNKHWTLIPDMDKQAGDIKYVWEKSRFSYLLPVLRYDYHFSVDCSRFIFDEINSWIEANPVNSGPNYRCSQEISLRVMNWMFFLYYYRDSNNLTETLFQKIMHAIYWQMKHVRDNINFSRIAVRNNHAITECLGLYMAGTLFPFLPGASGWKKKGKEWLEKEILYQIYEDGTYLQFSMNYHRVVLQLMTWAFALAEANNDKFSDEVYDRLKRSLDFLYSCQDKISGSLPNYGANDGALFFRWNSNNFRDYRPQLNAMYYFFNNKHLYNELNVREDSFWFFSYRNQTSYQRKEPSVLLQQNPVNVFKKGGYATINEGEMLTFMRCGNHHDRPSHADNLHLDLWYQGDNIMRDAGSFMYNTEESIMRYFYGTASHNTIMLERTDQMEKGPRFVWFHWTQALNFTATEENDYFYLSGKIEAFRQTGYKTTHERTVIKYKNEARWVIDDKIENRPDKKILQIWNPSPLFLEKFKIEAVDENGKEITPVNKDGWYSHYYGHKVKSKQIVFETTSKRVKTTIRLK